MRLSAFMLESLKKETLDWSYVTRYLTLTVWMVDDQDVRVFTKHH